MIELGRGSRLTATDGARVTQNQSTPNPAAGARRATHATAPDAEARPAAASHHERPGGTGSGMMAWKALAGYGTIVIQPYHAAILIDVSARVRSGPHVSP